MPSFAELRRRERHVQRPVAALFDPAILADHPSAVVAVVGAPHRSSSRSPEGGGVPFFRYIEKEVQFQ